MRSEKKINEVNAEISEVMKGLTKDIVHLISIFKERANIVSNVPDTLKNVFSSQSNEEREKIMNEEYLLRIREGITLLAFDEFANAFLSLRSESMAPLESIRDMILKNNGDILCTYLNMAVDLKRRREKQVKEDKKEEGDMTIVEVDAEADMANILKNMLFKDKRSVN